VMPRLRIPLWAAVAIPIAAYLLRSALRGSAAPDLPRDAIVFGILFGVLLLGRIVRAATDERGGELDLEVHDEHDAKGRGGQ